MFMPIDCGSHIVDATASQMVLISMLGGEGCTFSQVNIQNLYYDRSVHYTSSGTANEHDHIE